MMAFRSVKYMAWTLVACVAMGSSWLLFASDSDGSSGLESAFLTFYGDIDHDHVIFRSYQVTPSTRTAFAEACAHGKSIWVNGQHFPCLSFAALDDQQALQVEVPRDAEKLLSAPYHLISVQHSTFVTIRDLNGRERLAYQRNPTGSEQSPTRPRISAAALTHAKAMDVGKRPLVFIPYKEDKDGNYLTYVFSVSSSQTTYVGKLPNWPEKFVTVGPSNTPLAVINPGGDALVVQACSLLPQIEVNMFVGEGE
jgi:hypothetical protein